MAIPPSTLKTWPVIYPALSEARKATVSDMSWVLPKCFIGICSVAAAFTLSLRTSVIAVAMKPGATAFAVIPLLASSLAADLVMPMTPALAAQ